MFVKVLKPRQNFHLPNSVSANLTCFI